MEFQKSTNLSNLVIRLSNLGKIMDKAKTHKQILYPNCDTFPDVVIFSSFKKRLLTKSKILNARNSSAVDFEFDIDIFLSFISQLKSMLSMPNAKCLSTFLMKKAAMDAILKNVKSKHSHIVHKWSLGLSNMIGTDLFCGPPILKDKSLSLN